MAVPRAVALRNALLKIDPTLTVSLKNMRINGANVGCSGFVRGAGGLVYVNTEESVYGPLQGKALYRTAEHEKDYTGGCNRFATYDDLPDMVVELANRAG